MTKPITIRATVKPTVIQASPVAVTPKIVASSQPVARGDVALAVLENTPDLTVRFEEAL